MAGSLASPWKVLSLALLSYSSCPCQSSPGHPIHSLPAGDRAVILTHLPPCTSNSAHHPTQSTPLLDHGQLNPVSPTQYCGGSGLTSPGLCTPSTGPPCLQSPSSKSDPPLDHQGNPLLYTTDQSQASHTRHRTPSCHPRELCRWKSQAQGPRR